MSEVTDDFLQHYGVVGMKWGKRSGGSSKSNVKAARKQVRKDIYKSAGASVRANKGKTVVGALLLGPSATTGIALARAAGHSKGASVVVGMLGGAPGGMLAVNLAARHAVANDDD